MQGREQVTLDQTIRHAATAGTLVRSEAVAVFFEVLRLASESQAIPDASMTLLEENGTLTFRTAPGTKPSDPGEPIRAACRLANRLFSAAKLEPPLSLAGAAESAPERFPTLRHLRDAFELELLLAGTPPPTDVEGRTAIAAVMAKARQPRGRSAGSARGVQRPMDPHTPTTTDPHPRIQDDPSKRVTEPPEPIARLPGLPEPAVRFAGLPEPIVRFAGPEPIASFAGLPEPVVRFAGLPEPVVRFAGLPEPVVRFAERPEPEVPLTDPPEPVVRSLRHRWSVLLAAVQRAQPQWLQLVAVGAMGMWLGVLLGRGMSNKPLPDLHPVAAALGPEIALPPPDMRPPPVVVDSKGPARERKAPATAAQPSPEGSPRPVRKLRRRSATAVADAGSAVGTKLQAGDDSLKQGRFFEALMAYREALDQDPPVPAAARRLGDAYREHQDTDLAVTAYERYLELAPGAPDADEVRAAVEQLRSSTPLPH